MLLQTVAMPADTNPDGDIFGGWLMAQLDIAGGIMARTIAQCRVATVAVDALHFRRPVHMGDLVSCYGKLTRIGTTSVTLHLEAWVRSVIHSTKKESSTMVAEATFSYVALDHEGKKSPINPPSTPLAQ